MEGPNDTPSITYSELLGRYAVLEHIATLPGVFICEPLAYLDGGDVVGSPYRPRTHNRRPKVQACAIVCFVRGCLSSLGGPELQA